MLAPGVLLNAVCPFNVWASYAATVRENHGDHGDPAPLEHAVCRWGMRVVGVLDNERRVNASCYRAGDCPTERRGDQHVAVDLQQVDAAQTPSAKAGYS